MTYYKIHHSQEKIPIGKIICLARTYANHAKEMKSKIPKEPILFLKPESAIIFSQQSIIIPKSSTCLHHEVELGVVIGQDGRHITEEAAMNHVFGYLIGLDITARDIQSVAKKQGLPWSIAKGFDTFAPISDVIEQAEIKNPHNVDLYLKLNGELKQHSNTKHMIFTIPKIISFISSVMTLKRGDLILTGTPEGVGEIQDGDIIEAALDTLCSLSVDVKKER